MNNVDNKDIFSKNLQYYMNINNITRYDICLALGVPYTTFADWYNGKIVPRIDKIEKIADYLGIKKSDLIELKNTTTTIPLLRCCKSRL